MGSGYFLLPITQTSPKPRTRRNLQQKTPDPWCPEISTLEALGVLPVNTTGTISGLVYFNDAADEMCEDHNGNKICPKVEHRSAAMKVHHSKALMLSLLACLVATISAVQGLKLLYTEKASAVESVKGLGLWWRTSPIIRQREA